jgi:fumarate reductase flavoprotein subunit
MPEFDVSFPIIVAGAGACGLVAALAARKAGADVLVIERDRRAGGCSALSQGNICAAGTHSQADHGIHDSPDQLFADIMAKTRGQTDPVLARTIADNAAPVLDWLISEFDFPWELDGAFRAAYGHSYPRVHSWLGRGGADMIHLLAQKCSEIGVDFLFDSKLVDIFVEKHDRVTGIAIERPDQRVEHIGCEALILATSGFSANAEMVRTHMPEAAIARHNGHASNEGDGIRLGSKIGGALADMGSYQGYAMLTEPQGITVPPSIIVSGGFIVNVRGERFVDETKDISGMVHAVLEQPDAIAWVVYDAAIEAACAYIPETAQLMTLKAAKSADSIADLATSLGVPYYALLDTFTSAEKASNLGSVDSFGRDWSSDTPPRGSFRALKVVGALYHTQGGLCVDGNARVVRQDGSSLPNLYAGGGAARGVSGPSSWGYLPAMGLCSAVTLGCLAGRYAAALVQTD